MSNANDATQPAMAEHPCMVCGWLKSQHPSEDHNFVTGHNFTKPLPKPTQPAPETDDELEHLEGNSDTHDLKLVRDDAHHPAPIHLACDCGYTIQVSYRKWSWILQKKLAAATHQSHLYALDLLQRLQQHLVPEHSEMERRVAMEIEVERDRIAAIKRETEQ